MPNRWQNRKAPSHSSELSTKFQEIKGGPRDGSGGAVSEAISAAATGCNKCAKGRAFSRPTEQESTGRTTAAHKGQSMLAVALASTPSSPETTICMPPALEHTNWVSVGFKIGDAMATPMNSANQTRTSLARNRCVCALNMLVIISETKKGHPNGWPSEKSSKCLLA